MIHDKTLCTTQIAHTTIVLNGKIPNFLPLPLVFSPHAAFLKVSAAETFLLDLYFYPYLRFSYGPRPAS
jgi:hypothetical protein